MNNSSSKPYRYHCNDRVPEAVPCKSCTHCGQGLWSCY
ncbi:YgiT-type zinc finger protein [Roseomonas gilardii]